MIHRRYLEFDVTDHCTLKCKGCGHYSPHMPAAFALIEIFERDLFALAEVLHVEEFRLLGGEPLAHPQISEFLKVSKKSGIADRVSLCTNGQLIARQSESFFAELQQIDISIYPNTGIDYSKILTRLAEMKVKYGFQVNTSYIDRFIDFQRTEPQSPADTLRVYKSCKIAGEWGCHTFRNGRYYKCIKPTYQNRYLTDHGKKETTDFATEDGITIHDPGLESRLADYCASAQPLKSCTYCNGTIGQTFPHTQLKTRMKPEPQMETI